MSDQKKPRLITTGVALTFVSFLVLVGLYLARVSSKLDSLKQRNFRIAATLAEMTEKKLDTVGKILESEAKDILQEIEAGDLDEDVESVPRSRFKDHPCYHHVHWHPAKHRRSADNGNSADNGQQSANEKSEENPKTIETTPSDIEFRLRKRNEDHQETKELMGTLHVKAALNCFFSELSAPDVFDDVLIVDSRGEVVFQQGAASIRIRSRTLLTDRHGEDAEGAEADASGACSASSERLASSVG